MLLQDDCAIAPCLIDDPFGAATAVQAARQLGATRWASLARASCVPYIFDGMERAFADDSHPLQPIRQLFHDLVPFFSAAIRSGVNELGAVMPKASAPVDEITGEHYGRLFSGFSPASFFEEPIRLLRTRLERNGISMYRIAGQRVLDAGCGGGRYTVAWRQLGAADAVGVDFSATGIDSAIGRVRAAGIDNVQFERGDVLDLPFTRDEFDIVFSNGVLHHTENWQQGINELVRVLKPGGLGWLYVIEKPGGLFWDVIEVLRVIMKDECPHAAREYLRLLGIPANRIFYMLDHVMVPINIRTTHDEITAALERAGATEIRRLARGADFDRVEQLYQRQPFADVKYGIGENRYLFSKP
jgi:SAM-dependent methyltransferase